jgi:lipoamide acyltransferase component of branched-chain alpha-keto acid dehydrogenase complex, mitochondrial
VAIVAIGQKKILPRFDEDGNIIKAHIVNSLWSADHRVIDGATLSRFSKVWKMYLQNPVDLIWNMR